MSTLDTVLSYLHGKGLTPAQAAGVAGNLQVESGKSINPAAANPNEGAIGIAQWEGGRRTALQSFAASKGTSETDLGTQLDFLWGELQGPEHNALQQLTATSDAGTAAAVFDQYYERSNGKSRSTRVANAQAIAKDTPSGFWTGVGAGVGGVLGGVFGGNPEGGSAAGANAAGAAAGAVSDALSAINPFDNWAQDGLKLGLKLATIGVAGALVVVGVAHTVSK